jgi:hypothetical protein
MKRANRTILGTRARWRNHAIAALLAIASALCLTRGAVAASKEYEVKAAFTYHFTQFIEWPTDAFATDDAPFIVAVMGHDPFDGAMEQAMTNKFVGKHPIVVKHFDSANDIGPCQILFVPANLDDSLRAILDKVGKSPVLTVGESDAVMPAGGAIHLFLEDNRMRLEINPDVLDAAGLKASAKLMKLARIYKK